MADDLAAVTPAGQFVAQLKQLPSVLISSGQPPITWYRWMAMFDDWMEVFGFLTTRDDVGGRHSTSRTEFRRVGKLSIAVESVGDSQGL